VRLPPRWRLPAGDPPAAERLAAALGLSPLVARVLVNRGLAAPGAAARFLEPRLADLTPPWSMQGIEAAVDRLTAALHAGEPCLVFGDYDVDGVTAAAVLTLGLKAMGGRVAVCLPHREREGYGVSRAALERGLAEAAARFPGRGPQEGRSLRGEPPGTRLVVTVDCGIAAHDTLAWAKARGVDAIVTDHHEPPAGPLPEALAILNPRQPGCAFPFKDLAAVGVAFMLLVALRARLRERGGAPAGGDLPNLREYLDIVALGTLADVVPLSGDNRILATHGLRELKAARRPGLRALAAAAGVEGDALDARAVVFRLAPRLNAAGRVGDPAVALGLLLAEDPAEADRLAARLEAMNRERQALEAAALDEARRAAAEQAGAPALMVAGAGWHRGIIGIVAARLAEESGRPAAVIALDGEGSGAAAGPVLGRGSIRSGGGADVHAALARCADLVAEWGGHAYAAGFTVAADRIEALRARFTAAVAEQTSGLPDPGLTLDAAVALDELDDRFWRDVARLPPYGPGNPEPLFAGRLTVRSQRVVGGGRHLRLELAGGAPSGLRCIGFRMGARYPLSASQLTAAFVPELDRWQGQACPQLALRDLELGSAD
jgi:single-stranded-DNA-specific exonuclease